MFRTLVVPLDGLRPAERALRYAIGLAQAAKPNRILKRVCTALRQSTTSLGVVLSSALQPFWVGLSQNVRFASSIERLLAIFSLARAAGLNTSQAQRQ